jgi:DNA-binding MarR family transcriptional regulator
MSLDDPHGAKDLLNYRLSRLLASSGAMVVRLCEGRYGITRREWRLVAILAEDGPMSPSELAQQVHLERARVSALITTLATKKLLRREVVPKDARRANVMLTETGKALYDDLLPQSIRFQQELLAVLSAPERHEFEVALQKLTEVAERIVAGKPVLEKADRRHGGSKRLRER